MEAKVVFELQAIFPEAGHALFQEQDVACKNVKTGPASGQASVAAAISPKPLPLSAPNLQAQFSLPASADWDTGVPSAGEGTFQHDGSQEGHGRGTP